MFFLQCTLHHTEAHGQVISLPSAIYLAWELEVEQVFSHHEFSEIERVRAAIGAFTGVSSVWWSVHC